MKPIQTTPSSPRATSPQTHRLVQRPQSAPLDGHDSARPAERSGSPAALVLPQPRQASPTLAATAAPPAPVCEVGDLPRDWQSFTAVVESTAAELARLRGLPAAALSPAQAQRLKLLKAYHAWHSAKELPESLRLEAVALRVRQVNGERLSRVDADRLIDLGDQREAATTATTNAILTQTVGFDLAGLLASLQP